MLNAGYWIKQQRKNPSGSAIPGLDPVKRTSKDDYDDDNDNDNEFFQGRHSRLDRESSVCRHRSSLNFPDARVRGHDGIAVLSLP